MATTKAPQERNEQFWRILNSALELDFKKGHLRWTMSDLSRKSSITRSLIYYYFGKSKISILEKAVHVIAEEVIGVSPERMAMWKKGDWMSSMQASRKMTGQAPFLCAFYLNHRDKPTEIGSKLREMENSYLKKLESLFPHLPPAGIRALFAAFFGISFAPVVDDAAVEIFVKTLRQLAGTT